ncbi:MAG: hypothetical protein ABIA37_05085 [Candidatus Woesearchaeota archaeon]
MINNDEYEILPHKLLEDLKYDVETLKKKLSEPEAAGQELIAEMEDLKTTIKEMNNVFKEALQDIKEEDSAQLLAALQNKIQAITSQNEVIARGMVAISDKLEDFMGKHQTPLPVESRIPPPSNNMFSAPPVTPGSLPPPPIKKARTGLFK